MRAPALPSLGPILTAIAIFGSLSAARALGDDHNTAPAGANYDTTVLMARDAIDFNIFKSSLPSDPLGGGPTIVSWSPPSRGTLSESSTFFTYAPDEAFRLQGSDSFRYRFLTPAGIATATVFLVADLGPGDEDDGRPDGETTAGGDTVLVLDIGDPWTPDPTVLGQVSRLPATTELTCARDGDGIVRFKVLLGELTGGERTLQPQAFENGGCETTCRCNTPCDCESLVSLPSVPLAQGGHTIYLDWWASFRDARNGGLIVRDKNKLVSQKIGLDNAFGGGLSWTPPNASQSLPSASALPAATSTISRSFERSAGIPMPFPPGFADSFEDGTLEAWLPAGPVTDNGARPGGLLVSADAATAGSLGLRASLAATGLGATLLDPSPDSVARYRARFDLRIDSACVGAADLQAEKETILLAGLDAASGRNVFQLGMLVVHQGAFRVTARVIDDNGQWRSYVQSLPVNGRATLDVEWWAATGPGLADGGLALRIDGAERPWPNFSLANAGQRIGSVHFGAVGLGGSRPGSICLDELESWF